MLQHVSVCKWLMIVLLVPPRVLVEESLQAVSLAGEVMLHCAVEGDPSRIRWTKNGEPLEFGPRIRLLKNGTLSIYGSTVSTS